SSSCASRPPVSSCATSARQNSVMEPMKNASHLYEVERRAEHAARPGFRITELQLSPSQKVPWHYHNNVADTFYVLGGNLRIFLREPKEEVRLSPGESYRVPARRPHLVTNGGSSSATFLVLQGIGEYDFVPLVYGREPPAASADRLLALHAGGRRGGAVARSSLAAHRPQARVRDRRLRRLHRGQHGDRIRLRLPRAARRRRVHTRRPLATTLVGFRSRQRHRAPPFGRLLGDEARRLAEGHRRGLEPHLLDRLADRRLLERAVEFSVKPREDLLGR